MKMNKKYILILELETEIRERISVGNKEEKKYFDELQKEFLKNGKIIRELFRLLLISDLAYGSHLFELDKDIINSDDRDEIDVIMPVLQSLSDESKEHFTKMLESDDKKRDEFFDTFFHQFGTFKVTKTNFMEKGHS